MTSKRIAVACGGTGGHSFPGMATALELKRRGHEVTLWVSGRDIEATSLRGWDGSVEHVRAAGFQAGASKLRAVGVVFQLATAISVSLGKMRKNRPDVLLAMGSYASVGPVLAARLLGVPVVLHEANSIPGRAVEFLSRFAEVTAVTFERTGGRLHSRRVVRTGLPIRSDLSGRFPPEMLDPSVFTVLAMGGSQGARSLNEIVTAAVCRAAAGGAPLQVIHLTGAADEAQVRAVYEKAGIRHCVFAFLREMGNAYGSAHMAISRSGAGACMELAACGVPPILVPLPWSMRGHQAANAAALAAAGAAEAMAQPELTPERLAAAISKWRSEPELLATMREALRKFAQPDATSRLADLVLESADH